MRSVVLQTLPVFIGSFQIARNVLLPDFLHFAVDVEIELVVYDREFVDFHRHFHALCNAIGAKAAKGWLVLVWVGREKIAVFSAGKAIGRTLMLKCKIA